MKSPLRIIHLEDIRSDADLIARELKKGIHNFERIWVTNKNDFVQALQNFSPDIVLSDHSLPSFTSIDALKIVKESGKRIPFILITATVSEEFAVSMMKEGIDDYVLKDRLQRLPKAIENAIQKLEADIEKEKQYQLIITEKKKFRALLENISDAIIMLSADGNILYHSPSVYRTTGYTFEETAGLKIFDFLLDDDQLQAKTILREVSLKPGNSLFATYRMKHKAGHFIWVEGTITNLLHDDSVKSLIINYRDVTERKDAELLLQKSEANLRTIFNNTKVSYVFLDKNYKIISFNQMAHQRYIRELKFELAENKSLLPYLEGERDALTRAQFDAVLHGEKINYEAQFSQNDGSEAWYNIDMLPVSDDSGRILGMIISSEDITARKNAELERERMTEDILKHNKDLEQFAYIISHNLRSPVANILGLGTIIKDAAKLSKSEFEKCLDGLVTSVSRLDDVITDLNFILQTRREVDDTKEVVNFSSILANIINSIDQQIIKQNVTITHHFAVEIMFTVKSYIHSIFYNLISNSIKYRNPARAPIIDVSSEQQGRFLILKFKDNGLGIALEKHSDKVFGLYKKFHPQIEGKGMGLYMVKTQVEILGGKIAVESVENEGTVFTITFKI